MEEDRDLIIIDGEEKLNDLISDIKNGVVLCDKFRFSPYELRDKLLQALNIKISEFEKKYYIFDFNKKIHISESEWNYILISTIGLVAFNPTFKNDKERIVYACSSQYEIMMILFEKIDSLKNNDDIYDIDSYNYDYLSKLTTGLVHNIIFYLEVFAKSYISLNGKKYKSTHNLKVLLTDVKEIMFASKQNDSLFHAQIFLEFQNIVNKFYLTENNFKEHFIKYNDSIQPSILIDYIKPLREFIEISNDFIIQFFYDKDDCFFLKQGLLNSLIARAKNEEEKNKVENYYKCLMDINL